jgi:hypothetical protein
MQPPPHLNTHSSTPFIPPRVILRISPGTSELKPKTRDIIRGPQPGSCSTKSHVPCGIVRCTTRHASQLRTLSRPPWLLALCTPHDDRLRLPAAARVFVSSGPCPSLGRRSPCPSGRQALGAPRPNILPRRTRPRICSSTAARPGGYGVGYKSPTGNLVPGAGARVGRRSVSCVTHETYMCMRVSERRRARVASQAAMKVLPRAAGRAMEYTRLTSTPALSRSQSHIALDIILRGLLRLCLPWR